MAGNRATSSSVSAFLKKLENGKSIHDFRNGEIVFSQGDQADSVFYVQQGKIKETVTSKHGKQAILAIVETGQFFGEASLVAGHPLRFCSAVSMGQSTVLRFQKATVVRLLHKDAEFADQFVSYLLARTIRVEEDLVDQLFNSTEKRLARILLVLSNFGKDSEPRDVIPQISQDALAQMVGASRPRVSSFMNKFRKLGFIRYNGGLRVNGSLLRIALRD